MKESGKNEVPVEKCPSPELVAHHEAGHAVVALALCVDFEGVTTDGKNPVLKGLDTDMCGARDEAEKRDMAEARLMTVFAGQAAERRFLNKDGVSTVSVFDSEQGDDKIAKKMLISLSANPEEVNSAFREEIDAYAQRLRVGAKNLLARPEHWASVVALAEALLEEKTISPKRAQEIVKEASQRVLDARPEPKVIRHEQE